MRILKHGNTNKIGKCYWCDCIFEYSFTNIRVSDKTVKCPECGNSTSLDDIDKFSLHELNEVLK